MSTEPRPAPSRLKRLTQNLALLFGTFVFCVLLLEITLRLCGYGNLEVYEPDPRLYWKLKPNQDCFTKVDHKPVHINSQGTRGPEFSTEKPPGTLRVLSLGDSRTFGWGLNQETTYSGQLQRLLQERVGGRKKVEVINAGVNAWSYPQMFTYFREVGLKYRPDYVILGEANLFTQFGEQNSPEFVRQFMFRVRLKNLARRFAIYHYFIEIQLQDYYARYRTKFIPVDPRQDTLFKEQQRDPESVYSAAIEGLCRVALTNHIQPVLLVLLSETDLKKGANPAADRIKQETGGRLNVPVVNPSAALLAAPEKTLYLDADPVHFNEAGNTIIARQLFQTMTNFVAP